MVNWCGDITIMLLSHLRDAPFMCELEKVTIALLCIHYQLYFNNIHISYMLLLFVSLR